MLLLLPEVFLLSVFLYFTFSPQATAAAVRYFYPKICIDINPPPTKLVDIFLSHKMKDSIWILLLRGLKYFHSKIWLLLLSPLGERRGRGVIFSPTGEMDLFEAENVKVEVLVLLSSVFQRLTQSKYNFAIVLLSCLISEVT